MDKLELDCRTDRRLHPILRAVYAARRNRQVNPEGTFDGVGRWYPSGREDADDFTRRIRSPSGAWPYSYMCAARSRRHVLDLLAVGLAGGDVPPDIAHALAPLLAPKGE